MKRMFVMLLMTGAVIILGVLFMDTANTPGQKQALPKKAVQEPSVEKLQDALDQSVAFKYADTPLSRALKELSVMSGVNISCDRELEDTPVSLAVSDMVLRKVLWWITVITEAKLIKAKSGLCLTNDENAQSFDLTKREDVNFMNIELPEICIEAHI